MKTLTPSIPARYYRQLAEMLEAQGTPCREALDAARMPSLNDPQAMLTPAQANTLLEAWAHATGRQDLGFELGRLLTHGSHGELGYALVNCASVEQSLRLLSRYYGLVNPLFALRYRRLFNSAEIVIEPLFELPPAMLHFHLEMQTVALHMHLMTATQGLQPAYDVHFGIAAPPHAQRYRTLRHARFHFGAGGPPGVRLHLPSEQLDKCMAMHDPVAMRRAEARCQRLLRDLGNEEKWSDRVAAMLRRAEDYQPSLEELARTVNMSRRTLERHLMREGVPFRTLAFQVRNERARQDLSEGKYPVSQIAYRLGYTDCANFSRWFKKLNGVSPSCFMAAASL